MRKGKDIYISFVKDGKETEEKVRIFFISNRMRSLSNSLDLRLEKANKKIQEIAKIEEEIIKIEKLKKDAWVSDLSKQSEKLSFLNIELVNDFGDNQFFNDRLDLIQLILSSNGIKNEMLLSREFWDECVEPIDMYKFIRMSVNKDLPSKKKSP